MKKNDLLTIIKKEFARFFGDKRMLFTALMPGLLIYVLYSVMGSGFAEMSTTDDNYVYEMRVVNLPNCLTSLKEMDNIEITEVEADSVIMEKEALKQESADILMIFPEHFDDALLTYDVSTSTEAAPNVEIYYNSLRAESSEAFYMVEDILTQLEQSLVNKFDICAGNIDYDLATDEELSTGVFASLLPMLVMTFLFTGCLSAASESIAGEKERGTIATLLVTPMRRRDLALGKIISLSAIGLISALSSFIGTMLSLPKIMDVSEDMSFTYHISDYILLLVVILSTTMVIVGFISVLSAFAKSVKEASTMSAPFMALTMIISLSTMTGVASSQQWYLYLIPVYNSVQCMGSIFAMDYQIVPIILTLISNLAYSGILVTVLTKMFNSEKIMYT